MLHKVVPQLLTLVYKRHMYAQRPKIDSNFLYQETNFEQTILFENPSLFRSLFQQCLA